VSLRRLAALACAFALLHPAPALAGRADTAALHDGHAYDRFIVRFAEVAPERFDTAARQHVLDVAGNEHGVKVSQLRRLAVGADVIRLDRKLDRAAARALMQRLANDPHVAYVEVDGRRRALGTPNDPNYAAQWHYYEPVAGINLPAAHDLATGAGVVVAVIDTGTTPHSDLAGQFLPGYDFISDSNVAMDTDGRDADPTDEGDYAPAGDCDVGAPATNSSWHGTHVAGTIAMLTDNGKGMAGVAPGAKLLPVRVLGRCGGYDSDIADAIVWAAGGTVAGVPGNANPAEVINLSLGGKDACSATTQAAIDSALARGAVVVAAAGNDNKDASAYTPAGCSGVIAVGAVDRAGSRATYSNYGATVDLSAPGGDATNPVWSTSNASALQPTNESYAAKFGTSMAAPHVAGTVALMQSLKTNPPAVVEAILKATARPLPVACPLGCGAGLLDAAAAVAAAAAMPTLSINDVSVIEGDSGETDAVFTIKLSWPTNVDVSYNVFTGTGGSATAGTDYTIVPSTKQTIPAGATSGTFIVKVKGDLDASEVNETFGLNLHLPVNATIARGQGIGTILHDDDKSRLLSISDATVDEGNAGTKTMTFIVSLNKPAVEAVGFSVFTVDTGSATGGVDYVTKGNPAESIAAGMSAKAFTVTINADTANEADETFQVKLGGPLVNATFADQVGIGTIRNDDPTLSIDDVAFAEGQTGYNQPASSTWKLTARLSRPASGQVQCLVRYTNGTATAGSDFASTQSYVTFAVGATVATTTVSVNADLSVEADETFTVDLECGQLANATVADGHAVATILNDDVVPNLTITDSSMVEGNSGNPYLAFCVNLSWPTDQDVIFFAQTVAGGTATAGTDYTTLAPTQYTIPAGSLYFCPHVAVKVDTTVEDNETVWFNVFDAWGATIVDGGAKGQIFNDDGPTLSINGASLSEGNSGTRVATFAVSLSQAASVPVTYTIATANGTATGGTDFVAKTVTGETIPAGMTSKTFDVTINGDTAAEPDETFQVKLSSSVGATVRTGIATGQITDDDRISLSIFDAADVNEGGTLYFSVQLSQASPTPVSVRFTTNGGGASASSPTDYDAFALLLSFKPGETQQIIAVPTKADAVAEPQETVVPWLYSPSGARLVKPGAAGIIRASY